MSYRELAPSLELRGIVAAYWMVTVPAGAGAHRVLPDGCSDIVVRDDCATVVGTMTTALVVPPRDRVIVGVRFKPGEAARFLPSVTELVDGDTALSDLWGGEARALEDGVCERIRKAADAGSTLVGVKSLFENAIRARLAGSVAGADARLRSAIARLTQGESVTTVAAHANLSERQLHRRFVQRIGVSPKTFARVMRLQRAAEILARRDRSLAAAAASAGFADQAHFTREVSALAGVTPAVLAAELGMSDSFNTDAAAPASIGAV